MVNGPCICRKIVWMGDTFPSHLGTVYCSQPGTWDHIFSASAGDICPRTVEKCPNSHPYTHKSSLPTFLPCTSCHRVRASVACTCHDRAFGWRGTGHRKSNNFCHSLLYTFYCRLLNFYPDTFHCRLPSHSGIVRCTS